MVFCNLEVHNFKKEKEKELPRDGHRAVFMPNNTAQIAAVRLPHLWAQGPAPGEEDAHSALAPHTPTLLVPTVPVQSRMFMQLPLPPHRLHIVPEGQRPPPAPAVCHLVVSGASRVSRGQRAPVCKQQEVRASLAAWGQLGTPQPHCS